MHYHCVLGAMQLKFCALKHFAQDALAAVQYCVKRAEGDLRWRMALQTQLITRASQVPPSLSTASPLAARSACTRRPRASTNRNLVPFSRFHRLRDGSSR